MRTAICLALALAFAAAPISAVGAGPIVSVESGKLEGVVQGSPSISIFRGIPFAAPATGALRWAARYGDTIPNSQAGHQD